MFFIVLNPFKTQVNLLRSWKAIFPYSFEAKLSDGTKNTQFRAIAFRVLEILIYKYRNVEAFLLYLGLLHCDH